MISVSYMGTFAPPLSCQSKFKSLSIFKYKSQVYLKANEIKCLPYQLTCCLFVHEQKGTKFVRWWLFDLMKIANLLWFGALIRAVLWQPESQGLPAVPPFILALRPLRSKTSCNTTVYMITGLAHFLLN